MNGRPQSLLRAALVAVTLGAFAHALRLGEHFGLSMLYADQWRNTAILLDNPFPWSLAQEQNGQGTWETRRGRMACVSTAGRKDITVVRPRPGVGPAHSSGEAGNDRGAKGPGPL